MAQNRKTISNVEFNKRVRDLVSRDNNRLRQTFQKFDREYETRLAEIQNMQEKVRHSMRSLAQDKKQVQAGFVDVSSEGRGRETDRTKGWTQAHLKGGANPYYNGKREHKDETTGGRKKHGSSNSLLGVYHPPSSQIELPSPFQYRRRHSLPHGPTFLPPGSPKEARMLSTHRFHSSELKTHMVSSPPKEASVKPRSFKETYVLSESPKETHAGQQQWNGKHRLLESYRLSVGAVPITASRADPVACLRVKLSPRSGRKRLLMDSARGDNTKEDDRHDWHHEFYRQTSDQELNSEEASSMNALRNSTARMSLTVTETEPRIEVDPDCSKTKRPVARTRSSSLPVVIDPDAIKNLHQKSSHSGQRGGGGGTARQRIKNKSIASSEVPISSVKKEKESPAKSFEGLRRCRYLRTSDIDVE